MADLDRDERIKLNTFLLSSGANKKILEPHMHLPADQFFSKIGQKWNASTFVRNKTPGVTTPTRPFKEYRNTAFNRHSRENKSFSSNPQGREILTDQEVLCYYHRRWGKDAFRCKGEGCKMSGIIAAPQSIRVEKRMMATPQMTFRANDQHPGN